MRRSPRHCASPHSRPDVADPLPRGQRAAMAWGRARVLSHCEDSRGRGNRQGAQKCPLTGPGQFPPPDPGKPPRPHSSPIVTTFFTSSILCGMSILLCPRPSPSQAAASGRSLGGHVGCGKGPALGAAGPDSTQAGPLNEGVSQVIFRYFPDPPRQC